MTSVPEPFPLVGPSSLLGFVGLDGVLKTFVSIVVVGGVGSALGGVVRQLVAEISPDGVFLLAADDVSSGGLLSAFGVLATNSEGCNLSLSPAVQTVFNALSIVTSGNTSPSDMTSASTSDSSAHSDTLRSDLHLAFSLPADVVAVGGALTAVVFLGVLHALGAVGSGDSVFVVQT